MDGLKLGRAGWVDIGILGQRLGGIVALAGRRVPPWRRLAALWQVLEEMTLVVAPDQAEQVLARAPWWVAVVVGREGRDILELEALTPGLINPSLDARGLAGTLHVRELRERLADLAGARLPRHVSRYQLEEELAASMDVDDLVAYVRICLRSRQWVRSRPGGSVPECARAPGQPSEVLPTFP